MLCYRNKNEKRFWVGNRVHNGVVTTVKTEIEGIGYNDIKELLSKVKLKGSTNKGIKECSYYVLFISMKSSPRLRLFHEQTLNIYIDCEIFSKQTHMYRFWKFVPNNITKDETFIPTVVLKQQCFTDFIK